MFAFERAARLAIFCIVIANSAQRTWAQDEATIVDLPEDFVFPPFTCEFSGQFPYVVSVRDGTVDKQHLCGGVVIASNAVLTAAHCLDRRSSNRATVTPDLHIGGSNSNEPIEVRQTILAEVHEGWTGNIDDGNDLVILKLNEETCVEPIFQLGAEDPYDRSSGLAFLGYGRTSIGGIFSFVLNSANMNTLNITHCNERYGIDPPLTENAICARTDTTVGICTGDDGGPLILSPTIREFRDVVIGIASTSTAACSETEGVSILMNVYAYRDWIEETLASERFINA